MNDFTLYLLSSVGINVILSSTLIWITKSWIAERLKTAIKHEYDEKLETHKAQLKAQSDIETERLRSQLNMTAVEHQVRFAGIYNKRADVIAKLYDLLVNAYRKTESFASMFELAGEPDKYSKYVDAMKAIAEYYQYFDTKRIYLPEGLCNKLDCFTNEIRSKTIQFGLRVKHFDDTQSSKSRELRDEAWDAIWKYFEEEVPATRLALEKELRNIIGE